MTAYIMKIIDDENGNDAKQYSKYCKKHRGKEKNGQHGEKTSGNKKDRKKLIIKICLIILGILCLACIGTAGAFFYLRAQGEKNLKTEVPQKGKNTGGGSEKREGLYITYEGKEYQYNSDIINILCLGIDKDLPIEEKRETGSEGLSDAILLVSVNVEENSLKIMAVPRETIVPVKVLDKGGGFVGTENKQITLQYAYGRSAKESCELTKESVSNLLYGLPIQRYCSINFQALPLLNDAIGGVDLTALETVEWAEGAFYQGQQLHLQGQSALDYVRQRDETVPESSMGRLERQKQYITAYIDQGKEAVKKDMSLPVTMYQQLAANMCTDLNAEDITYLASELLDVTISAENISMVPGDVITGGEYEEYHVQTEALKQLVVQNFYKEVPKEQ